MLRTYIVSTENIVCRNTQNVHSSNTNFSTMHQRVYNTWDFYSVRKRNPDLNSITKYPRWFKILPRSRKLWPKEIFWRDFNQTAHCWVHAFWYWSKSVSRYVQNAWQQIAKIYFCINKIEISAFRLLLMSQHSADKQVLVGNIY